MNVTYRVVPPPLPLEKATKYFSVHWELSPNEATMSQVNEIMEMEVHESTVFHFSQPYNDKTVLDEQTITGGIPTPKH